MLHLLLFCSLFLSLSLLPPFANATAINHPTKPIKSFCIGGFHACAVFTTNKMKCWGQSIAYGSTINYGTNSSTVGDYIPYFNPGTSQSITQVSCAYLSTCILLSTKKIKCTGENTSGQVGIGATVDYVGESANYTGDTLPVVDVGTQLDVNFMFSGYAHNCVLVTGDKVKCFGSNLQGQLGYGDTKNRGRSPNDMGDNLQYLDFGSGTTIISFHTGSSAYHNCVILFDPPELNQRVKCWGLNQQYQLGYGTNSAMAGNRGDDANEMGDSLPAVDFGIESKAKQMTLGGFHTCAVLSNDVLKCFGYGNFGQLGSGSTAAITSTGASLPSVLIDSGKTIKWIIAGQYHTCIAYDDLTTMKCFGYNGQGQLGQGDTNDRGDTPTTMIPNISPIDFGTGPLQFSYIYRGYRHNCVVFKDSSVKCFGFNDYGQLVIGSTASIGIQANEMGTNLPFAELFSPSQSPTTAPTLSPAPQCNYPNAKLCKSNPRCVWQKAKGVKKCVPFDCTTLNKSKCGKERKRCKWNKTIPLCEPKAK